MKNRIKYMSASITSLFVCEYGILYITRRNNTGQYLLRTLTRYKRVVRLLNAFVEGSMK